MNELYHLELVSRLCFYLRSTKGKDLTQYYLNFKLNYKFGDGPGLSTKVKKSDIFNEI